MKKSHILMVMLFSVAAAILPAHAAEFRDSRPSEKNYREDELIVKFRSTASESEKENIHKKHGSKKTREFRNLRLHQVKVKKGLSVQDAIEQYKRDPKVEFAEPNFKVKALVSPNDQFFFVQWGLNNYGQSGGTSGADIHAPLAWDITTGSSNVVVAVLDTGIDYTHSDLVANMWVNINEVQGNGIDDDGDGYVDDVFGVNMMTGSGDPMDDNGHGTHVAGIIGASGNNGLGVAGVNWNVKMMSCKFLGADGTGDVAGAIACLQYIKAKKDAGINIVASNNSWGCSNCYSQALYDAINAERDILFVAAAGNDSTDNDRLGFYPAAYDLPNLIAVAATDANDGRAYFSDYGRRSVHVGAPGDYIYSTLPVQNFWGITGGYGSLSGTSMAAPYVTGLTALVKSHSTTADWREIKNLVLSGGDNTPSMNGTTITGKRINAHGSLACVDSPLFSVLQYPSTITAGVSTTLSVLSINCGSAVGPVTVTLVGGASIELRDDGIAPDLAAGDGIFTGAWTPSQAAERLTFSSSAGTETIVIPALTIASTYLTEGNIHASYSSFLAAAGGFPNYTWSISSGGLPPGVTLNSSTGEISGHPTTTGKYNFTAQVTDAYGDTASKALLISVLDDAVPQVWVKTYDRGADEYGQGVAVDASGQVYVTGYTEGGSNADYVTLKYDTAGNPLWTRTYDTGSIDRAFDLAVDKSGNTVVTGLTGGAAYAALTIKYDSSGNVLWARTFDQGFDELARAVAIDGSGNVYITGYSNNGSNSDYQTIKYDPAGNVVWTKIYDAGADELPYGIAVDNNGNVYVTGLTISSWPNSDILTVKYDPSGNLIWATTYDSAMMDWARGIAVDENGNVYVAGFTGDAFLTIKYDPSGKVLWSNTYAATNAEVSRIALDVSGNSYVIGNYYTGSLTESLIIKYDPSGNIIWTKTLDSGSPNYAGSIAVDADNMIYVTGAIHNGTNFDFFVVKYNQLLTTHAINASAGPHGSVSPSGKVNVYDGEGQTFTILPDTGYHVSDVLVDGVSQGAIASYTFSNVIADHTIGATFAINTYTVTPTAGPNGTISPSTPQTVDFLHTASFTVTPNTGYHIASVTGCSGSLNGGTYTTGSITANCEVSATFAIGTMYSLTVSKAGTGSGTVTSSPGGINCGGTCSAAYASGTKVTLTATPNADSLFTGWSGGVCYGTGTCITTMNAAKSVIATFNQYITVTKPNGGESWNRNGTYTIRWNYAGNPGANVKIELLKGGALNRTITSSTSKGSSGSGSYTWRVPGNQTAGSDYTIRVTSTSNRNYNDTSNANFTIQ